MNARAGQPASQAISQADSQPVTTLAVLGIAPAELGLLMPMALWLLPGGQIRWAGPTLAKLTPAEMTGTRFLDQFTVRRPRGITTMAQLQAMAGRRLHLELRGGAQTALRGLAIGLVGGQGMVVNLSFGIALTEAIAVHGLTDTDFAPTDPTVEMLYLAEAKTAVAAELGRLNLELARAKTDAEHLAQTDTLTGLRNRRAMDAALLRATEGPHPFALMHLDLDFFKEVNDRLGHAAGDQVLRQVGRILCEETRTGDVVARVGGDEFVVILNGVSDPGLVARIAARVIERLTDPITCLGETCQISASIGSTLSGQYAQPLPDRMLSDADGALYASKHAGRGRATAFSGRV